LHGAGGPPIQAEKSASPVLIVYLCGVRRGASGSTILHQFLALRSFPCVIGRHPECDHRLSCPLVSRRHCEFSVRGGRVWVEDLGSLHGTRLNGQPVEGLQPLHDGDRLHLACLPFEVRLSGRKSQAPM
jgi:predicted component of type VI protein secretion system